MKLRTKFLVTISFVLVVSFGATYYQMSTYQDQLIASQARQQARILAQQVILTRKWVSDHKGVYLIEQPGVKMNPYLDNPVIVGKDDKRYVLYNPAKVTRALSNYTNDQELWKFRVTSLKPTSPYNYPDEVEAVGLKKFESGDLEYSTIELQGQSRVFRYMQALKVRSSCMGCHEAQGYKVGDIKGGLSFAIPMKAFDDARTKSNKMLIILVFVTITITITALYLLIDVLVVQKIKSLSYSISQYPAQNVVTKRSPGGRDEIDDLASSFQELGKRLMDSQAELERTQEQIYQSEKLAALGRFSAGVAHEINNPLGGMLNCVKGIKAAPEDRDLNQRYIDLIEKGLKQIEKTVRGLLKFGHKEPLSIRETDVDVLIRDCFALMTYNLKRIQFHFDLRLHTSYFIDAEALKQIIVNIGLNAIQSISDKGQVTITSREVDDGISITVEDDGEGIEEEDIRKIFDPFYTTKSVDEGTGLGLSVSYALAQRMGGNIEVFSQKDRGSRFLISFPHLRNIPDKPVDSSVG